MKIYTKTGDLGETSLLGGKRVPKHHLRIDTYGTVDELNSHIGLLKDQHLDEAISKTLLKIQNDLFTIGSMLATPPESENTRPSKKRLNIPQISSNDVAYLEKEIDRLQEELPEMTHFVLPGGHPTVSICHITRCVCRRAERIIVLLHFEEQVNEHILAYFNRLSDYLFVLARKLTRDNQAEEIPWIPGKIQ